GCRRRTATNDRAAARGTGRSRQRGGARVTHLLGRKRARQIDDVAALGGIKGGFAAGDVHGGSHGGSRPARGAANAPVRDVAKLGGSGGRPDWGFSLEIQGGETMRRKRTSGKTLLEAVIIISMMGLVVGLAATSLATLFRLRQQMSHDSEQATALARLSTRL